MALDLAERVEQREQRELRTVELNRRDKEHGGLTPHDRADEEKRRSVQGWGPYRAEVTAEDVQQWRRDELRDIGRVTVQRLWIDCGAAVRRFAPAYKRERAATLRNDALLILVRWPRHGGGERKDGTRAPVLDLGGDGGTPLRRDWLEPTDGAGRKARAILTAPAWHALRAAVKQAQRAASEQQLDAVEDVEQPTDALDIARLVEEQQLDAGAAIRLPDGAAPEIVADALGVPLDAGRAIVSRAYPAASVRELAAQWGIGEQPCKTALTRGARAIRERFPDPSELLDALDAAGDKWRATTESSAILTLIDYRDGMTDESAALDAVREWRGASDGLDWRALALIAATRAAMRRHGASYGDARAERIARSVPRLIGAEQRRARSMASASARGSHLNGTRESASALPLARFTH